jgi:hypothetical protein
MRNRELAATRKRIAALVLCGAVLAAAAAPIARPAQAQQFAAEIVRRNAGGDLVGKPARLFVADHKVRIESPDLPNHILIVDVAIPAAYALAPAQRLFMDVGLGSELTRLFVPLDPDDPCRQWRTMAAVAGPLVPGEWHCTVEGRETVEARSVVKFNIASPEGRGIRWVDPTLKFPLKIETADGAQLAVRNIEEGPQAAEKFDIPADYKKYDPRRLIEYLKHTDIWVEH